MKNKKTIAITTGVAVLLVGAYFAGRQTQKTNEIITPSVQSSDVSDKPSPSAQSNQSQVSGGVYNYMEAEKHIGETTTIRGTVVDVYTSKTGTTFFDFCKSYKTCTFSAVIFASNAGNFQNLKQYTGQTISITGQISSYQGKAEIIVESQDQISN